MTAPTIIMYHGNPFPVLNGEVLCWNIGAYDTLVEREAGNPRAKAVIAAMREHRPAELEKERRDLQRASFDRMFGRNAARLLALIDGTTSTSCGVL